MTPVKASHPPAARIQPTAGAPGRGGEQPASGDAQWRGQALVDESGERVIVVRSPASRIVIKG